LFLRVLNMSYRIKRTSGYLLTAILGITFLYYNFVKPRWKYIIIHHSSTKIGSVRIFRNGHEARGGAWLFNDPMLYHLVIGDGHGAKDGELQKGGRWLHQQLGGGCCTVKGLWRVRKLSDIPRAFSAYYNITGIHICVVGDFAKRKPTAAQLATLTSVVEILCRRYHIPPERILGHREAQLVPTDCPGRYFPLKRFRTQIARRLKMRMRTRKIHLFNWKIRLVNFWAVLGILFGEYYFSLVFILFDIGLVILFIEIGLPLMRVVRIEAAPEIQHPTTPDMTGTDAQYVDSDTV